MIQVKTDKELVAALAAAQKKLEISRNMLRRAQRKLTAYSRNASRAQLQKKTR